MNVGHFLTIFAWRVSAMVWICASVALSPATGYAANGFEPIQPLPTVHLNPDKVQLGERLFHDSQLSRDNTISCASCHNISIGGVDRLPVSRGIDGAKSALNSPTVLNSGFNFRQFWNGRATSLEEQIEDSVHAEAELASDWPSILRKLRRDGTYRQAFKALYPEGIQRHTVKDAIATFERSLVTPSRFDRFLRGDANAISPDEKRGYALFKRYGCVSCHQGTNVGGNMFQHFGIMGNYFKDRGNITKADYGRYNVTGREGDQYVFKVPSLRNVALTPPYFHDGSATTLAEAVRIMAKYQLGRVIPTKDRDLIILFLHSLTGEAYTQQLGQRHQAQRGR